MRIIQGGVTTTSLRALLIARSSAPPAVMIEAITGGAQLACNVTQLPPPGQPLRTALDQRGVSLYLIAADALAPATAYRIAAAVGGESKSVVSTTLPACLPAEGLTIAVATCYYDGYRRDVALRNALSAPRSGQTPAFQIWAGDNLYMDVPSGSLSSVAIDDTVNRYLAYFLDSGYADARALVPTFTTFDDHEYWNNYPETQFWLMRSWEVEAGSYSALAKAGMQTFQNCLNMGPAIGSSYYQVDLSPLSFFIVDTRSYRTSGNASTPRLMTAEARAALKTWCDGLAGPGVLVLGQPLWIAPGDWRDYNPPHFTGDYAYIWSCLRETPYDMLVVSGDVHHSRVLKIALGGTDNRYVYEFVTSPACHIPKILGSAQDHGDLSDAPGSVVNSGQQLSATAFFGTDAPNSFGLLRLVPMNGEVRVGASFVEYYPDDRFAAAKPLPHVPRAGAKAYDICNDPNLFTLRMR